MKTFVNKGNDCEYLGTSEVIHGATFYHCRDLETGLEFVTSRHPETGFNPIQHANAMRDAELRQDFNKLHK